MLSYLVRRLVFMVPTLLGITLMVFMLLALAPGGIGAGLAVQGGQMSDTSRVAQMQAYLEDRYGLNDPVIVQYARWIGRISPVKFGQRDLRAPSGDRVPMPRAIDLPSLAGVFAPPPAEVVPPPPSAPSAAAEIEPSAPTFRSTMLAVFGWMFSIV